MSPRTNVLSRIMWFSHRYAASTSTDTMESLSDGYGHSIAGKQDGHSICLWKTTKAPNWQKCTFCTYWPVLWLLFVLVVHIIISCVISFPVPKRWYPWIQYTCKGPHFHRTPLPQYDNFHNMICAICIIYFHYIEAPETISKNPAPPPPQPLPGDFKMSLSQWWRNMMTKYK